MGFVIGLLTFVMVLDCAALIFLVLIQLPKKDAGAGLAFGGAATDALFGAGSGNVLTNITKYAATIFFVLAVALSALQSHYHTRNTSLFENALQQPGRLPVSPAAPASGPATAPSAPTTKPTVPLTATNILSTPTVEATNVPSAPPTATNAAPSK
jgi:preprotein translocase subunit SecG